MRKFLFFLIIMFFTQDLYSQSKYGTDSVNCIVNLSLYREYYKQKNYVDAMPAWRWVFLNCPEASGNIYKNGPTILKALIKQNPDKRVVYIDTLMLIYDRRIEYFGKEGYVLGRKGADLLNYSKESYERAYRILAKSIDIQAKDSEAGALYSYFKATTIMEKNGLLSKKDVLEAYVLVLDYINYNLKNKPSKAKYYNNAIKNVEKRFKPYANCDDIIAIYMRNFDSNTEDLDLLRRLTNLLEDNDCVDNQLYFTATERLYELEPTASSASKIGKMYIAKKQHRIAISYFDKAIQLQQDSSIKAKYFLQLAEANIFLGLYSNARNAIYSSIELNSAWGKPYMVLGNLYVSASKSCGNTFQQSTVYWVAVDAFRMALNYEETAEDANKRINTYSRYFPTKTDCFSNTTPKFKEKYNLPENYIISAGDTYTVECWINKSTTVRLSPETN